MTEVSYVLWILLLSRAQAQKAGKPVSQHLMLLCSSKEVIQGIVLGSIVGVIKEDSRVFYYSSCEFTVPVTVTVTIFL